MSTQDDDAGRWAARSPAGPPPPPAPGTTWLPGTLPAPPPPPPLGPAAPTAAPPVAWPSPPPPAPPAAWSPAPPPQQPTWPPGPSAGWPPPRQPTWPPGPSAGWPPAPPPAWAPVPVRRRRGPTILATVVVWALVMVVIVVGVPALTRRDAPPLRADGDPSDVVRLADPDRLPTPEALERTSPTPGFEEADTRLAAPVEAPEHPSYRFLDTQVLRGHLVPIAWSPCRPVHVVLNPAGAPDGFEEGLLDALGVLSEATGLVFVYDGETAEPADVDREAYQPYRYGDRWAPVLAAWTDDDGLADLEGDVVGLAMSHTDIDPVSGAHVRVSGLVFLDTDLRRYPRDPTGQPAWVSVLHHELGHLVGLDHVTDESQLMHPQDSGTHVSYEDGDRAGLAELGRGTCAPGV